MSATEASLQVAEHAAKFELCAVNGKHCSQLLRRAVTIVCVCCAGLFQKALRWQGLDMDMDEVILVLKAAS